MRTDPSIVYKINEVRFTQGDARLNSVSVLVQTSFLQYSSPFSNPQPADPVSLRSKCVWKDSEIRIPITCANEEVHLVLSNRRRRVRTVIGKLDFNLASLDPPLNTRETFKKTLCMETRLFPSLNVKFDIEVTLDANIDCWKRVLPRSSVKGRNEPNKLLHDLKLKDFTSISAIGEARRAQEEPSNRNSQVSSNTDTFSAKHTTPSSNSDSEYESSLSSLSTTGTQDIDNDIKPSASTSSIRSFASSLGKPNDAPQKKTWFSFNLNHETIGVVFLEIVSVANLPKFRTLTGISFDMDPFVVISFGKRVYKTPHKRHTLNPTFNSKVAFDINKSEKSFSIVFTVWDQDKITLNDKVAECSLPLEEIMKKYSPQLDKDTMLYDITQNKSGTLMLPMKHAAGTAEMMIKVHFSPLAVIRQQMWRGVISLYENDTSNSITYEELKALLNSLGSSLTTEEIKTFFSDSGLDPMKDEIPEDDVVKGLERITSEASDRMILFRICPICHKKNPYGKHHFSTSLGHLALCSSRHWAESSVLLDSKYISSQQASKRWYTNFLSKFSFGSYQLGAHSANILVQDRNSGQIFEEKMRTRVRLGIRLIYALGPVEKRRFQKLLKKYTVRSGIKFSSPSSADSIQPFIKFHHLDMSEVLKPVNEFKTFNDFFYRELKPGSRPCENSNEPKTVVSMADCRLTCFRTIDDAIKLWIKGKNFTVKQLIGNTYPKLVSQYKDGSCVIFRLAPQDYHRVHSPVDGIMGKPKHIDGQYFSVNPMAIRSGLDVFGENTRTVFPIQSDEFGQVLVIMVGAMMVGSCVVTAKEKERVSRTGELGYFQFGGSTVVLLFQKDKFVADADLQGNSNSKIETLVRVGMSIGHAPGITEYNRSYDTRPKTILRAKSAIHGGGSYLPFSLD